MSFNCTIPQRTFSISCIITKKDNKPKTIPVPTGCNPCIISGLSIPGVTAHIKMPPRFKASFQLLQSNDKLFIVTYPNTQLFINDTHPLSPNDFMQLRSGDWINVDLWRFEIQFCIVCVLVSSGSKSTINLPLVPDIDQPMTLHTEFSKMAPNNQQHKRLQINNKQGTKHVNGDDSDAEILMELE